MENVISKRHRFSITMLLIIAIFALFPAVSPAGAKIPLSLSVGSGLVIPRGFYEMLYDTGPLFSAGLVMDFNSAVSLELQTRFSSTGEPYAVPDYGSYEYPYGNDTSSNTRPTSNRINLYGILAKVRAYPLHNIFNSALSPYLCFSIGTAFFDQSNPFLDSNLAYNSPVVMYEYGGGIKYRLSPKTSILGDVTWTYSKFKYEYTGEGVVIGAPPFGNPRPFDQLSISVQLEYRL